MSSIPQLNNSMSVPQVGFGVQPNVPSLSTNMGDVGGAAAWTSYGEAPREYGKPTHEVNETIQHQHVVIPWDDMSNLRIHKYQPVFVARNLDRDYGMHNDITLAKLNEILRTSHQMFQSMVSSEPAMQVPEAVRFQSYLKYYGEDQLECYHHLKRTFGMDSAKLRAYMAKENMFVVESAGLTAESMAEFYEMATQPVYRYQTKFGILSKWNRWGVVINTSAADTADPGYLGSLSSASNVTTVNTAVKGYARMYNFAGTSEETRPMRRVWLVLRRSLTRNGTPGHFEVVPKATFPDEEPCMHVRRYLEQEQDGDTKRHRFCEGHLWNVGIVRDPNMQNVPLAIRESSIALNSASEQQATQIMPTLPQIVMELGI